MKGEKSMAATQTVKVKHPYIISSRKHCGGSPVISGTKFPVRSVVFYILKQGITPEELVKEFSHLNLPQIYDALSYYYEHKEQIDKELSLCESSLKEQIEEAVHA